MLHVSNKCVAGTARGSPVALASLAPHNGFSDMRKEVCMQSEQPEENVFGEHDGSSYSATLGQADGVWYCSSFVVDEHNILLNGETWPTREAALDAIRRIASGDRAPL